MPISQLNMPDRRTHRGANPQDARLFAPDAVEEIRSAVADYSLLLSRGYAEKSALKLVGDRFSLTDRQRTAVMRSSCSDEHLNIRTEHEISVTNLTNKEIAIDGYNVLITIEAAMSGAIVLKGRDSCFRDLASIHGTYRKVTETIPAIQLIGDFLSGINISKAVWFLDKPISNSGRLKKIIEDLAGDNDWNWLVVLSQNPDTELIKTEHIIASSDSVILDSCRRWVNLAAEIIKQNLHAAKVVDLSG